MLFIIYHLADTNHRGPVTEVIVETDLANNVELSLIQTTTIKSTLELTKMSPTEKNTPPSASHHIDMTDEVWFMVTIG